MYFGSCVRTAATFHKDKCTPLHNCLRLRSMALQKHVHKTFSVFSLLRYKACTPYNIHFYSGVLYCPKNNGQHFWSNAACTDTKTKKTGSMKGYFIRQTHTNILMIRILINVTKLCTNVSTLFELFITR